MAKEKGVAQPVMTRAAAAGIAVLALSSGAAAQIAPAPGTTGLSGASQSAPAAAAQASSSGIGDIVVTAQKRSESVQAIPLAVTALNGAGLQAKNATTVAAFAQQVPGLNVSEQVGQARVTLRGIGVDNISTGAESSVAFNQDGVFYSRSAAALASFYDVERIEVLRGPQGTLYGRNATGGSVNILTNRPTTSFEAGLDVTGGNDQTINSEGFVSGPLTDTLSGRFSFQTQHHDGYGKNLVTGDDVDTKNSQAGRGQLLFKPDDRLSILIGADYYRSKDRSNFYHYFGPAGETADGAPVTPTAILLGGYAASDPRDIATETDPHQHSQFYGARIDATYKLSDIASIRSISAYRRSEYTLSTSVSPFSIELFPLTSFERSNQYSQELQLNVDTGRNKLAVGLYYLHERIVGANAGPVNLLAVGGPDLFTQGFYGGGALKTDAAAAYAQDTYSLTDKFRLTLGGRYSWERKAVDDVSAFDLTRPYSPDNAPIGDRQIAHKSFKAFTPKVGIDYDVATHTLAYASFSRGFKSGTYNLGGDTPALKPEKVDAYEAGLKTTFADGRLRANIAGFYYNYTDLQVGKVQGEQVILENAATARIYGLEGEFTAKPTRDLTLSLNTSWLHARFRKYVTADQARPGGDGVTIDPSSGLPAFNLAGNTLSQSPNYTVNLGAEYVVHLSNASLRLRGESTWVDKVYFTPFDRDAVSQPAYNLQNAFVSYQKTGAAWSVSLFVRNLRNKTILASGQVATSLVGSPVIGFLQPPRTYGGTIGYRF
jgi:iron complex outermembrane recepter protein